MKLCFCILLIITIFPNSTYSQNAYYDAIALKRQLDATNHFISDRPQLDTLKIIFGNYVDTLNKLEKRNPFLNDLFDRTQTYSNNILSQTGSLLSSLAGLDITNIADGLAKFLVKRTKQELTISFFSKFDSLIAKYPDLRTVFPQTYQSLSLIGDEIYNYQGYIQTLRESFEKDLQSLNTNLPTIIDNHRIFFAAHKELAATLKSGCYIAGDLRDKVHPGDILANYPAEYLDSLNPNWKGAIQTLQLISSSLRDTSSNDNNTDSVNYWVSAKQIKQLVSDPIAFKIYLGLIYQEAQTFDGGLNGSSASITFANGITLDSVLRSVAPTYTQLSSFFTNFGSKADKLNKLIKQYQKQTSDSLLIQQYYNYANASIDLFKHAATITDIPVVKKALLNINLSVELHDYFDVAQSATDLVLNISKRNYSAAIVNVTHVYDIVIARQSKHDVDKYSAKTAVASKALKELKKNVKKAVKESSDISALRAVDIKEMADTLSINYRSTLMNADTLASLNNIKAVQSSIFKYGSFMAAMVQAQSSADVENVIESFALPTGSSRIKRVSDFNVSLNAYAGLFYGVERIRGVDSGKWKPNVYGVAAPIGVATSWGHHILFFKSKHEWSTSIYLSLIDLGAIAAFRFTDDSTAQVPTIQLKDIFSPGAFLSIGIPKTPLSFNFGAQMGPNLRKVNNSDPSKPSNDYTNKIYWRYSISVCVDIPVLNFYSKSK